MILSTSFYLQIRESAKPQTCFLPRGHTQYHSSAKRCVLHGPGLLMLSHSPENGEAILADCESGMVHISYYFFLSCFFSRNSIIYVYD